jgi:succinate dehydrogenase / fumarate reductase iron-sulfur subunit
VARRRRGERECHYDEFDVPYRPGMTVLDALISIRTDQDPGLTLRHSCRHASCGTCGMRVNGRERLACVTPVGDLGDKVLVEPLSGAAVLSDLVVDMRPFYEALEAVGRPQLRAVDGHGPPDGPVRLEDCIECGLCTSACPLVATDRRYLGPAALAAAERVVREPRGQDPAAALALADQEHGAWRCHVALECSQVCPAGLDPAGAIMELRRELLRRRLGHKSPQHEEPAEDGRWGGRRRGGRRGVRGWLDPRGRHSGMWTFVAGRLTGLGLLCYLYLHLIVLSLLTRGPGTWDRFIEVASHPAFLALDVLMIAGLVVHGLHGVRVALLGSGLLTGTRKALMITSVVSGGLVVLTAALFLFS